MAERNTPIKDAELIPIGVAASTKVEAGKMGARNSGGYMVEASDAAGLVVLGRIEETVDNSSGANGAKTALARRKNAFKYKNSATHAATIANVGGNLYVEDDETVSTATGTNSIVAGKCVGVDSDGVWIEHS